MANLELPSRILKLRGIVRIDDPYIIIDLEVVKEVFINLLTVLRGTRT